MLYIFENTIPYNKYGNIHLAALKRRREPLTASIIYKYQSDSASSAIGITTRSEIPHKLTMLMAYLSNALVKRENSRLAAA